MNRSLEQALISLLPTHNGALPQPLVDLAGSLLAQSHLRSSTLKKDEEIARCYACAHLACDRLKITLNLPPIAPSAPIPPRVYKRLYSHLDNIIPATTAGTSTPSRSTPNRVKTPSTTLRERLDDSPLSRKSSAKEKTLAQLRNREQLTPIKSSLSTYAQLPPWLRPVLRLMCKDVQRHDTDLAAQKTLLAPTIFAGVEAIALPHGRGFPPDEWARARLSWVLGAVFAYTWSRILPEKTVSRKKWTRMRGRIVEVLARARTEVACKEDEGGFWAAWRDASVDDIEAAIMRITRHGGFEMEWTQGVEELIAANRAVGEQDSEDGEEEEAGEQVPEHQAGKADSMFQERYDFLSARRRQDYAIWKGEILRRIKETEDQTGYTKELDS